MLLKGKVYSVFQIKQILFALATQKHIQLYFEREENAYIAV